MKTTILIALSLLISFSSFAQTDEETKKDVEWNCYSKWVKKFEERKSADVEDGTYDDVIITVRNGSNADCFNGKVDVKAGKIGTMYLKMEDGIFEPVKKRWKYDIKDITIINGMSKTMVTIDDELINVLFVKKILPKKKGYVKAADPVDD